MAATVTLTELKTRALRRADMVSSSFIDTTASGELEGYIQEAAKRLYDKILQAYGEDYYYASASATTVAGTATVALPANFYKLLGVDATFDGSSEPVALETFNWNERNIDGTFGGWDWYTAVPRYRLRAGNIWFLPTPTGAYPVTIHYVPTLGTINDSTNLFDGINGWDEYIVLAAAIKCLAREESDTSTLERELAAIERHIVDMAPSRDITKPPRVTDIYAADDTGWDDI